MKLNRFVFHCLAVLVMIGGYFPIRAAAFPLVPAEELPETDQQAPLEIPEEQPSPLPAQKEAALPDQPPIPGESFPISLVRIAVDSAASLHTLQELGFACIQLGACEVEADQAALTSLKEAGFSYEILRTGTAIQIDPIINAPNALTNSAGGNVDDYAIPDGNASNCGYAYSYVTISDAPALATVDYVEYRVRVLHTWPADLRLYISSPNTSEIIWDFLGGPDDGNKDDDVEYDDDIYLNHRFIDTTFDTEPVNQTWYFYALDCVAGDSGNIDYFEIWIWYDDGGSNLRPNLTPYSPSGWDFPIVPSAVDGTNTLTELYTPANTYIDWAVINNGSVVAPGFYSCLFLDTSSLNCWTTNEGLETNWYAFVTDWVLNINPSPGWHELRLETDYYNDVNESNENDNEWRYEFYWIPNQQKIYIPFLTVQRFFFQGPLELEPNNEYTQGNGPLISNKVYSGSSNDQNDYFYFNALTDGTIQINLSGHTGQGVQLLLYYQSIKAGQVNQCHKAPDATTCTITHSGGAGLYYLRIYTGVTPYTNDTYSLKISYP